MGARDSALRRPRSNQPKGGRREEEQGREQLHELSSRSGELQLLKTKRKPDLKIKRAVRGISFG